jgi:prophage antirepressor-like protein
MADIILFHFEQFEIRTGDLEGQPVFCLIDLLKAMKSTTRSSDAKSAIEEAFGEGVVIDLPLQTPGGVQTASFVFEAGATFLISRSRTETGKKLNRWLHGEVLPSIRKTGSYSIEQSKEKLERQFLPVPTAQNRIDALRILKQGGHKKEYIQRISIQMAKAICPDIEAPAPTEMASLPTAKALLTPTQIAEELQLFYSSGKGNAIKVNKLLSVLGYQEKIQGQWSATQKAVDANLCDRKPVDTNSRTQKDQLLWSVDIVLVLKEHILEVEK